MNLFVVLLLCVPAAVLAGISYDHKDTSCNCIPLEKCQPVLSKLKWSHLNSTTRHRAFTNYLKIIKCEYDQFEPHVCCPNEIPREVLNLIDDKTYWIKSRVSKTIKRLEAAVEKAKHSKALPEKPSATQGDSSETPVPASQEPKFPYQFPGCGRFDRDLFPLGTNATNIGAYAWLALLEYDTPANGKQLLCGGVLISDQHILTAAHCVTPRNNKLTSVILGEHDTSTNLECISDGPNHPPNCVNSMRKYDVDYTIVPGEYNDAISQRNHNIALVKLKTKVQITPYVYPICLPMKKPTMTNFRIAGWGRSSVSRNEGLKLKLTSNLNECEKSESDKLEIKGLFHKEEHICAGTGNRSNSNACIVDSGGPLMAFESKEDGKIPMTVFGISNMESTCQSVADKPENLPGVFTNVYNYKDWIFKYMNV